LTITGYAFGRVINCVIQLEEHPLPYGGERWYALCPRTGRRSTALVLPPGETQFASVKGWNVAYGSQRECPIHRGHRTIDKAAQLVM
jgi:ATP sulfurylase